MWIADRKYRKYQVMDNVLKTGMPDHEVVYVIIKLNVLEFENVHLSINDCMRIFFLLLSYICHAVSVFT